MKIHEVAQKTGVTVRALQYYDKIGLLAPSRVCENGYRQYDETDIKKLQQILFLKELGFSLKEIKKIVHNPDYDERMVLIRQKDLLIKKKKQIEGTIELISCFLEGKEEQAQEILAHTEIEQAMSEYASEIQERWGSTTAYAESMEKTEEYGHKEWSLFNDEGKRILADFGKLRKTDPTTAKAKELVMEWQNFISTYFYHCTDEILQGLGEMYAADERFQENIDLYGKGTAAFLSKAIAYYTKDKVKHAAKP